MLLEKILEKRRNFSGRVNYEENIGSKNHHSKGTGASFSIFALIVIWLAFFGGWSRVVDQYQRWFHPKTHHTRTLGSDEGIKKAIEGLKKPVPGDAGR